MKHNIILSLLVIGIWSLGFASQASADLYPIGITPLKIDISTRAISLGGAMTAVPDIDSQFYNPGCLPWAKGISVNLKDLSNITAAQAYPLGNNMTVGLGFVSSSYKDILTSTGSLVQTSGNTMVLSYGSKLSSLPFFSDELFNNIGLGVGLKYLLNQSFSETGKVDRAGSGYDIDAGLYLKATKWFSLGLSGHNLLPQGTIGGGAITWTGIPGKEGIPAYFRFGGSAKLIGDLNSPIYKEGHELMISADYEKYLGYDRVTTSAGLEYAFQNSFFFKGGFKSLNPDQLYSYFGLGYKTEGWGISFASGIDPVTFKSGTYFNLTYIPDKWFFLPNPLENVLPLDNTQTYKSTIEVSGNVKKDITLNIDNKSVNINPDLTFKYVYNLNPGLNSITIESIYETDHVYRIINVTRKPLPANPFASLNIYNNFSTDEEIISIKGKLISDANSVYLNNEKLSLTTDLGFEKALPLKMGENNIVFTVYLDSEKVEAKYLIYRRASTFVAEPPATYVAKKVPHKKTVKKHIKKKLKRKHKKIKKITIIGLKSFKEVQELIRRKTSFWITSQAKFKMSGYFGVYVLSDYQYLALRDMRNGLISIDYYETKRKTWRTIAKATYSELLMFNTKEIESKAYDETDNNNDKKAKRK